MDLTQVVQFFRFNLILCFTVVCSIVGHIYPTHHLIKCLLIKDVHIDLKRFYAVMVYIRSMGLRELDFHLVG